MTKSDNQSGLPFDRIDTSRRSFLQKSAIASGAVAFGGTAGCVGAEEHDEDEVQPDDDTETDEMDEDHVFMLYPDAVENANARVVSDEIDWLPWEDDNGVGDDTDDTMDDDGPEEDNHEDDENGEYRTHLVEFEYSASHVAPLFLPEDAEFDVDDDVQLGEIEELVHGPDDPLDDAENGDLDDDTENGAQDDENGVGNGIEDNGQAILARISLEDEPMDDDPDDEVEPDDEPDDEDPIDDDDTDPADDTPADDTNDDNDDGILDDDDNGDDDDGLLSVAFS